MSLLCHARVDRSSSSRYRDDWGLRHFLHPKLLKKAREVRVQLEDIMKFQKMDIISAGTDFDVIRYVARSPARPPSSFVYRAREPMLRPCVCAGKRSRPGTSTRRRG